MGLVNFTGFETGDTAEIDLDGSAGTYSVQGVTKRTGAYALRSNPVGAATGYAALTFYSTTDGSMNSATYTSLFVRAYFYAGTLPAAGSEPFMSVVNAANGARGELRISSTGIITAYDSTLTLVGTGTTTLSTGIWYRIDEYIDSNLGRIEVRVNGVQELQGLATLGANEFTFVHLGKRANRSGQSVDFYYDDIMIRDDYYPPDGQSVVMIPDSDGYASTWTVGAGPVNKWDCVDEIINDGDTSYLLSTKVLDNIYSAALQSAAGAGISGRVNAVKALAFVKRDGASNGAVRINFRSGAVNRQTSANTGTGAAYTFPGETFEIDPNGSIAWSVSALDSIEVGVAERSTTQFSRCSGLYAMVDFDPNSEIDIRSPMGVLIGS